MNTLGPIPLPPLTARPGADAFNTIIALVRNRTGLGYDAAFNQALRENSDLLRESVLPLGTTNLGKVLNRSQIATGLPSGKSIDMVADRVYRMTNRFAPGFVHYPTALNWDVFWRTALMLEQAGIPEKLFNRRMDDPEVSQADWDRANACEDYVFALLNDKTSNPIDRGTLPQFQTPVVNPGMIRGTFRSAIIRMMADGNMTLREAFDKLKADEPIFWTLALLSFEPEK